MRVLADTCVWSRFLRKNSPRNDAVAAELERLIRMDAVQMLGAIQALLSRPPPRGPALARAIMGGDRSDRETGGSEGAVSSAGLGGCRLCGTG
jgi:hypothetical protein